MKAMQSIFVLAMVIFTPLCQANDFPTADRVAFVLECMRDHKEIGRASCRERVYSSV